MKSFLNHKISFFIPALLWMSVIFYFSSQSTAGIGHTQLSRLLILKTFHLIEYAILAILLLFAYKKYKYAIITAYLYAISDELHQYFVPGRTSKFTDTLIDLTGIILGSLIIHQLLKLTYVKKYLLTSQNKLH